MECYFLDIECFQHGSEEMIIKELSVLDITRPFEVLSMVFQSNKPWSSLSEEQKRTYSYQTRRLHHLHWKEGEQLYSRDNVAEQLATAFPLITERNVFVIGCQKAVFLRKEFNMLNIVEFNCERIKDLIKVPDHIVCTYRNHGRDHCAVLKCYRMYLHYLFA